MPDNTTKCPNCGATLGLQVNNVMIQITLVEKPPGWLDCTPAAPSYDATPVPPESSAVPEGSASEPNQ